MRTLFVLEAPGKIRQIEAMLAKLGEEFVVQATKGHLYSMPQSLYPLGIDAAFHEFERKPINPLTISYLRKAAEGCDRLYIATDADAEGDAIAWDVAELLRDLHPEPLRIRLKGTDEASILEALEDPEPVRKEDAIAARTRAIVDRMIAHTFSKKGVPVGRVRTALLGLVQTHRPAVEKLRLVAPATDGGRPWVCELPVSPPLTRHVAERLLRIKLPALSMKSEMELRTPPDHMGDIMVAAGDRMDLSPREVDTSMQRLYESGRLSYPRSGSRGMSKGVSRKLQAIIRKAGYKFEGDRVPEKGDKDTHDAPYPIGHVDISKDPERLGSDEGVRTLVARGLVKTGIRTTRQSADARKLAEALRTYSIPPKVIKMVIKAEWTREQGPRYPDQEIWPESEIVRRRPDTVLLEAAIMHNLGRPSTWASRIEAFMSEGYVDDDLNLTSKGLYAIQNSPRELLDVRMSAAIENACETVLDGLDKDPSREPWEVLAGRIIKAMPATLREPLMKSVLDEKPRVRRTYAEDVKHALETAPVGPPAASSEQEAKSDDKLEHEQVFPAGN